MNITNLELIRKRHDGGSGSGNWGHSGVEGQHGGSAPGGGSSNRYTTPDGSAYTSFAKMRNAFAKSHVPCASELKNAPIGSKLIVGKGETLTKKDDGTKWWYDNGKTGPNGEAYIGSYNLNKSLWNKEVKLAIPKSAEAEFMSDQGAVKGGTLKQSEQSAPNTEVKQQTSNPIPNSEVFSDEGYSDERVANANVWPPDDTIDIYKDTTEKCWAELDDNAKEALFSYTTGSSFVNEPLHEKQYYGYKSEDGNMAIKNITEAIDMCAVPKDTIMYHGVDADGFSAMMGLNAINKNTMSKIVGQVGIDEGFVSCGAGEGTGFQDRDVVMEIFVPEGAKGMYVEPFSHYGFGAKSADWDGKVEQDSASWECEVILQRGGAYKITGASYEYGQWRVQCQLVNQDTSNTTHEKYSKYTKKSW